MSAKQIKNIILWSIVGILLIPLATGILSYFFFYLLHLSIEQYKIPFFILYAGTLFFLIPLFCSWIATKRMKFTKKDLALTHGIFVAVAVGLLMGIMMLITKQFQIMVNVSLVAILVIPGALGGYLAGKK